MSAYPAEPVAVVGVGAILPEAPDVATFWANLTGGRYSITDVPPERWHPDHYYDPDPRAPDKTYSRIGGWVRDFGWDPLAWKLPIPPRVSDQMDGGQRWAVAASRAALLDAGWPNWTVDPERVAVILGNAIGGEKHYASNMRIEYPQFATQLRGAPSFGALPEAVREAILAETQKAYLAGYPEITEDTMPGELANIIAGRVANVFNFRGPNFTTDAACASGLAAMSAAVQGLRTNQYDAVLTGGVDRNMGVSAFVKFCKIGALSATGTRPFDAGADGFVMGEGTAVFVLKRLSDAERDGDRIYAVVLGVAGSSDGKGKGITAPNPVGQRLAVERAWHEAGVDPSSASYLEAHGTSTRVGDATELASLTEVFGAHGPAAGRIALGSVKSNIGHLKAAAGAAGVLKTVLSLHERLLVPSLSFVDPNPNVDWASSPFRVNTELREWPAPPGVTRRAGVSAFGFGGTNFHVVLEEYQPGQHRPDGTFAVAGADIARAHAAAAPAPLAAGDPARPPLRGALVVGGGTDAEVVDALTAAQTEAAAGRAPQPAPPDPRLAGAAVRVAIDYADPADLARKAGRAVQAFAAGNPAMWRMLRAQGVFVGRGPAPKVAFLYTGQGSQYVNMLATLRATEPIVAGTFVEADGIMAPLLGRPLTDFVYAGDDPAALARMERQLLQTEITQPAVLTADLALTRLLAAYRVTPDFVLGHSLGEYGALVAAGALDFDAALEAVSARGHEMASLQIADNGAMAAVTAPLPEIERIVGQAAGYVVIANVNSTSQAVIGGATAAVETAVLAFQAAGYTAVRIPVSHAFHTSIVAPVSEPLKVALRRLAIRPPELPIVANVTGEFYPPDVDLDTMLDILGRQVASPVQFVRGLHTLYAAGARVFVEVGPKKALHGFVEDVLGDRSDVLAVFTNHPKFGDIPSFNQALCGLYAAGLGYPAPAPAPAPAPVAAPRAAAPAAAETARVNGTVLPATTQPMGTTMPTTPAHPEPSTATQPSANQLTELGRLFAGVLEQGLRLYRGTAPEPLPARPAPEPAPVEPVVITGAALGLPGVDRVFDDGNIGRILAGEQFIDTIPRRIRTAMVDRHITRLVKRETGDPTFETIDSERDVIKLAGRHAPLDLVTEFGVDADRDQALDVATRLAIGAGFDALRDAGIPLVAHYRTTTLGTTLADRWTLPESMWDDTGVVFASAFPGLDAYTQELDAYHADHARRNELAALQAVRGRMRGDEPAAAEADRRIGELRHLLATQPYVFDRRFLFRCLSMGHSQFAELIAARGPNTQVNAACASTTQALAVAEDWIRAGRCRRVVVISADDATSDAMLPWLGSGFLASGAAATDDVVADAATPFDRRRHGMIVGMGAAAFVVESAAAARERGIQPICEVLGAVTANSAYHGTRLDVTHIGQVMEQLVRQAEARGVDRRAIAPSTVFVSHETYTPARGGSAAAEINALRQVFGDRADAVVITNTKGFTGHAMGAGVEDVVAIKALETGVVPPVPNLKEPDPELGPLNLSMGGAYPVEYALRLAAGFGSQIAMSLLRWTPMPDRRRRAPAELGYPYRIADPAAWQAWLAAAAGRPDARLEVVQRRLRIVDAGAPAAPAAAPAVPAVEAAAPVEAVEAAARVEAAEAVLTPPATVDPVADAVVAVVATTTGYPPELLDVDLDLEADLGVDTVKQAEVFAAVRDRFDVDRDDTLALRDFPTLAHVIGWVHSKIDQSPPAAEAAAPEAGTVAEAATPEAGTAPVAGDLSATEQVPRRVPVPVVRPPLAACKPTGVTLGAGSRVLVMLDQGGVGTALVKRLAGLGAEALVVEPGIATGELVTRLDGWLAAGPVHGVYWLPALDDEGPLSALTLAGWREQLRRRVKNLYAVAHRLADGAPFLVAGTRLGGYHGYDDAGALAPLGGAVTGFVKAYHRERPEALVKAVDFPASRKTATLAETLLAETQRDPGCVEVGHADDLRWTVGLVERPFTGTGGTGGLSLGPDSVFLVTGAAGSIVSAIVADLASASGGTFHLLDLTPTPDPADPDLRRYATDRDGLQVDLAARLAERGQRPTPVLIARELAGYERRQAALAAIDAVRQAGGTAHYHCVDLTDAAAVAAVVDQVRATSGRVDVLLHAAGLEISRSLVDKPPAEYDLVFDVKSDGWFNLLHAAGDLPIGATVAFSSIAGRFGNAGQTDYSAANDLLCKTTSSFRRTRPQTRGIVLDWTAWAGIGMATRGSIPKIMEMAGIEMLPAAAGIPWIRRELTGTADRGEVVVAGALGVLAVEPDPTGGLDPDAVDLTGTGPMIGRVAAASVHSGLEVRTELDPAGQPFLDDHRIDGTAVLPGVMGIEAFAEAAALLAPGWQVAAVEDVDFLAPVKFYRDEPRTLTVHTLLRRAGADLVGDCRLVAERRLPGSDQPQQTTHFTGRVRLTAQPPAAEREDVPTKEAALTVGPSDVYRVYFHGPAYQVVGAAWRYDGGCATRLAADLPAGHVPADRPTLTPPRLIELCFQTAGLWESGRDGRLALPRHVTSVRLLPATAREPLYAVAVPSADGFDCAVLDEQGEVVVRVDGYRTIALPEPLAEGVRAPLAAALAD